MLDNVIADAVKQSVLPILLIGLFIASRACSCDLDRFWYDISYQNHSINDYLPSEDNTSTSTREQSQIDAFSGLIWLDVRITGVKTTTEASHDLLP